MTHRQELIRQALEAVKITEEGAYVAPSGTRIDIAGDVEAAIAGRVDHRPTEAVVLELVARFETQVRVVNCTSLEFAHRLTEGAGDVLVMNFASAHRPGGGFLSGAVAQEESLARSSALHAALAPSPMYAHHAHGDAFYSDWMIWSSNVPVFRNDVTGELLERPYRASFLTAPAPNAGEIRRSHPSRTDEIAIVMRRRVERSLLIAALHGHTKLVLGAWGCGVFANDPSVVAEDYKRVLSVLFSGVFEEVVFAVLDGSADHRFIAPFEARFA